MKIVTRNKGIPKPVSRMAGVMFVSGALLATLILFGGNARRNVSSSHSQWLADAKTVVEMARYVLEPESPPVPMFASNGPFNSRDSDGMSNSGRHSASPGPAAISESVLTNGPAHS